MYGPKAALRRKAVKALVGIGRVRPKTTIVVKAPKQPAKKKAQAKKKSRRKAGRAPRMAPRQNVFSPDVLSNVPSTTATGDALSIPGIIRTNFTADTTSRTIFAITNTGDSGTLAVRFTNNGVAVTSAAFTAPTVSLADTAGGPTSGRAMKFGVSAQNTTQLLNRGGRVFVFHATQRVRVPAAPASWNLGDFNTVFDSLVAMPTAHAMDGSQIEMRTSMYGHVTDMRRYEDFDEWSGTLSVNDFCSHIMTWPALAATKERSMSTIFVLFEQPAIAQTYNISFHGNWYTRWSLDTVLGQLMSPIPLTTQARMNIEAAYAQQPTYPNLKNVVMGGVAGGLASMVVTAGGVGRRLGRR